MASASHESRVPAHERAGESGRVGGAPGDVQHGHAEDDARREVPAARISTAGPRVARRRARQPTARVDAGKRPTTLVRRGERLPLVHRGEGAIEVTAASAAEASW